jgi:hypothetical protein
MSMTTAKQIVFDEADRQAPSRCSIVVLATVYSISEQTRASKDGR